MPIPEIDQPEILPISDTLQLHRYDGKYDFALAWYQDAETVYLVDGVRTPYDPEKLSRMYTWLDKHGELYWIEAIQDGAFSPIGDVTLWQEDMPIVIGEPSFRGKGVGKAVVNTLIARGRALGFDHMAVGEIYRYNKASQALFESAGFRQSGETKNGFSYRLALGTER